MIQSLGGLKQTDSQHSTQKSKHFWKLSIFAAKLCFPLEDLFSFDSAIYDLIQSGHSKYQ